MPKRRRTDIWTPEDVFRETNRSYDQPDEANDKLNAWNRAVVLGGEHYKAWRETHIAPIERARETRLNQLRVWKREIRQGWPHSWVTRHRERNIAIVKAYRKQGLTLRAVGKEYGLSAWTINRIVDEYRRSGYAARHDAEWVARYEEKIAALNKRREAKWEQRKQEQLEQYRLSAAKRQRELEEYENRSWEVHKAWQEREKQKLLAFLESGPELEDAINHVQGALSCDRETARQWLRDRLS
jgi:transposase